jgi:hypothetical protein
MNCPQCRLRSKVIETRPSAFGLRRRRECLKGHRFTTFEMVGDDAEANRTRLLASISPELDALQDAIDRLRARGLPDPGNVVTWEKQA